MGELSIWHWLIVLLVVALIFGTGKLRDIGSDPVLRGSRRFPRSASRFARRNASLP